MLMLDATISRLTGRSMIASSSVAVPTTLVEV
jgi:hypothetical protein